MAKNKTIATVLKLQIPAGGANPSPPVGPALGQANVNIILQLIHFLATFALK